MSLSLSLSLRSGRTGRGGERYREDFARCDRLKNTPLFYMRRRLNGKIGKKYGERYRERRENDYRGSETTSGWQTGAGTC